MNDEVIIYTGTPDKKIKHLGIIYHLYISRIERFFCSSNINIPFEATDEALENLKQQAANKNANVIYDIKISTTSVGLSRDYNDRILTTIFASIGYCENYE